MDHTETCTLLRLSCQVGDAQLGGKHHSSSQSQSSRQNGWLITLRDGEVLRVEFASCQYQYNTSKNNLTFLSQFYYSSIAFLLHFAFLKWADSLLNRVNNTLAFCSHLHHGNLTALIWLFYRTSIAFYCSSITLLSHFHPTNVRLLLPVLYMYGQAVR